MRSARVASDCGSSEMSPRSATRRKWTSSELFVAIPLLVTRSGADGVGAGAEGADAANSPGSKSVISVTTGRSSTAPLSVMIHRSKSTWSTMLVVIVQSVRRRAE